MMRAKAFQAQSLDNRATDHLRLAGHDADLRGPEREHTYSTMASISTHGTLLFSQDGVKLVIRGDAAILQVLGVERDDADRLAPVLCWIECHLDPTQKTDGINCVWVSIEQFAASIGRSFSEATRITVHTALELLEKKKRPRPGLIARLNAGFRRWVVRLKHLLPGWIRFGG